VKLSEILSAPNQLTLLRMMFLPLLVDAILDENYKLALILLVLSACTDFLDGRLARWLKQQTTLGQYLDPIADKLLLSTLFIVLAIDHKIPVKYTVFVFTRDIGILIVSAVLYTIAGLRDFRPSIFGKLNTTAQIGAVFFVILHEVNPMPVINAARQFFLYSTLVFTVLSGIHYAFLASHRLRASQSAE
jgi:cardiolipin synthase